MEGETEPAAVLDPEQGQRASDGLPSLQERIEQYVFTGVSFSCSTGRRKKEIEEELKDLDVQAEQLQQGAL
jgi:hypothetical protein